MTSVLIFGDASFEKDVNSFVLEAIMDYLIVTEKFDEPLFNISVLKSITSYEFLIDYNLNHL